MGDVLFLATPATMAALVVLGSASVALAWQRGRQRAHGRGFCLHLAAFASIAVILAVTLFRDGLPHGIWPSSLFHWSADGWQRLSDDPLSSTQDQLNLLLFMPAGLFWTLLTGRGWRVLGGLVMGSALIEFAQAVLRVGAADPTDVALNSLGAALGVATGALTLLIWPHPLVRRSSRQRAAITVGVIALACSVMMVGAHLGAAHRQEALARAAQERFGSTTIHDFHRWDATDRLSEEVFDALPAFSDGTRYSDGRVEVRYPATFFGIHRCVFVVWSDASVSIRREFGEPCAVFIG